MFTDNQNNNQDNKIWARITNNIYIGNVFSTLDINLFKNHNIKNIISMININNIKKVTHLTNVNIIEHPIEDDYTSDIIKEADKMYKYIDEAINRKENVLVICSAGKSRSVSTVIYYLMKKYHQPFNIVHDYVKSKKADIGINTSFKNSLTIFGYSFEKEKINQLIKIIHFYYKLSSPPA